MMQGIIDRYLFREVMKVFLAVLITVVLVVVSMLFLRTLEEVNAGALSIDLVMRFTGLQLARDMTSLLPPVFFIALMVGLGRMSRDSELIAMRACGLGPLRTYRSLFFAAVPVAIATAVLSFYVRPLVIQEIREIQARQKEQAYQIAGLKQGRFYQHEQGQIALYVADIQRDGQLQGIFIHDRRGGESRLITSQQGMLRNDENAGERFVTLHAGRRYDGEPGKPDYTIAEFERYDLLIESREVEDYRSLKRATYSTTDLLGSDDVRDRAELQYRFSFPLAIFTLALIAVPLTTQSPRERGSWRLFVAFLTYFSFFNLQRLAANWFETGMTPPWLGSLWYQALILLLVAVFLVPDRQRLKRIMWQLGFRGRP
jgi:lipopolysaccharide export system permease protein